MARTPEQKMWDVLRPALQGSGIEHDRIESIATGSGIPDLTYTMKYHGWIELKADEKAIGPDTEVNLSHFTGLQRSWLRRRDGDNHKCFLMVRTPEGWYLIRGALAFALPSRPTKAQLLHFSTAFTEKPTARWLREHL